jgi:hypothetical protein
LWMRVASCVAFVTAAPVYVWIHCHYRYLI